ncbi:transposable element Tc1 transposase [Trichonephila clavipes]|nr:transposable element Tc1 transposase [Trichonephila clavipes]
MRARVQRNSLIVMRAWKQYTDEHRTTRKTGSGRRKVMLPQPSTPAPYGANWHQVVFSDESRFNLWNHDGHIRVRRYAGERCLPECVIERHRSITPIDMVWIAISYHGRSNLLRIEGNLNSNRFVREELQPEVVVYLQGIFGATFHQDNARPLVPNTVRDFSTGQHMQLFSWPLYSPDMSPIRIEQV